MAILLAEDTPDNVKVATLFLRKLGYLDVDVVGNGRDAISALARKAYDVISRSTGKRLRFN